MSRPPLPPFTLDSAVEKVRLAEDGWNSRNPSKVALAYTEDSRWRNRAEFISGRAEIEAFLARKWARELDSKGRPIVLSNGVIPPGGTEATTPCVPDFRGGTVYNPPSFDPALQLFYVMARETCAYYTPTQQEWQVGRSYMGGGMRKLAVGSGEFLAA